MYAARQFIQVMLKRKFLHGTTVAIGDGGNDTQMLAASDVSFAIARESAEEAFCSSVIFIIAHSSWAWHRWGVAAASEGCFAVMTQ